MVEHRWARPQWYETLPSTNRFLLDDPVPWSVVVADHQSQGQGRRGRTWSAPPGTSLAVSVVVPTALFAGPDQLGWVSLAAGLAAARAVEENSAGVRTGLKWPNDVLVSGPGEPQPRKVCGILAAVQGGAVVIGAGLNIDQSREQLPTTTATSWALAAGAPLVPRTRHNWLDAYLGHLAMLLEELAAGGAALRASYREACLTVGQEVRVDLPGGDAARGTATGVDGHGALLVHTADGLQEFHAGDVVHLRALAGPG